MLSAVATFTPSLHNRRGRHGSRGAVTKLRCSAEEGFVEKTLQRIERQMLQHVDIEPKKPSSSKTSFLSPQEEQIRRAERFMLDGWSSTSFHATGALVALLLAIMMILNNPMSTSHM